MERKRGRENDIQREREKDRETEREREKDRERKKRKRERESLMLFHLLFLSISYFFPSPLAFHLLYFEPTSVVMCSGSLVSITHVLTAAHWL